MCLVKDRQQRICHQFVYGETQLHIIETYEYIEIVVN